MNAGRRGLDADEQPDGSAGGGSALPIPGAPNIGNGMITDANGTAESRREGAPLVEVRNLTVTLPRSGDVVSGADLEVAPGECLAIVGESGAGKSVLARALLGLVQDDPAARVQADRFSVAGQDLLRAGRGARRRMRGRDVALVLQDALQSLDPLRTIEAEVGESLAVRGTPRRLRRQRVIDALTDAGLPDAESLLRRRSGELSGGMRQRALIASAMIGDAPLLIADEPTTALDATTAVHVLDLLGRMRDAGTALVLISHDLHAVSRIADRVAVIESGRIVEHAPLRRLLDAPEHPTTRALLAAVPSGPKPAPSNAATPSVSSPQPARCAQFRQNSVKSGASGRQVRISAAGASRRYGRLWAVHGADVEVTGGEVLGVVGESGSGKSTLARLLIGAERPDEGEIGMSDPAPRIRLVPQDPLGSFDPRHTVDKILRQSRRDGSPDEAELLALVGLDASLLTRRPATLSGGQRQRVAIARALAGRPDILVCDEPVSALDTTTQAGILDLLMRLQREQRLGMVFISHDLAVVRLVSDRVAVMRDGRIVEQGPTESVYSSPEHPITAELIAAVATGS
ncbi:ATP-binding cassette domain-containing protein [Microbacterium halotolerans]|uniref:ATP-binding cassette domain-containing protein n=1 Tax=Microbacterium halotolerans TaxID=246613 RepID=UPI001F093F39|nr:ABC transporter ATP-binding protein [Microbacterium halotolerans]